MTTTSHPAHPLRRGSPRRRAVLKPALIIFAMLVAAITCPPVAPAEPDNQPSMAPHGVEAPREAVPWPQVGPGWMLALWSPVPGLRPGELPPAGSPTWQTATTTLYLVDPEGGRYPITTFPPTGEGTPPKLADWSGDGTRALLSTWEKGQWRITEVDLRSGAKTGFTPEHGGVPRYTRPDGKAVLLFRTSDSAPGASLEQVDLSGGHQLTYPVAQHFTWYLPTYDGSRLVLGTASGLVVMGTDGSAGPALSIAGQRDCTPTRWWDPGSTIAVTRCGTSTSSQLWLVPIDGGTPTALTAPNGGKQGPDYGDTNAWQLPTGTYLQALGACGVVYLAKLNGDGTTSPVAVPEVNSGSAIVVGFHGSDIDLRARAGCGGGQSLIAYDTAAGTSTVLLGPPLNGGGVVDALPYPGQR